LRLLEAFPRPQTDACSQPHRRKEMSIDIADAASKEQMSINEAKNFSICSDTGLG
jgi:hypothetical protein